MEGLKFPREFQLWEVSIKTPTVQIATSTKIKQNDFYNQFITKNSAATGIAKNP